MFSRLIYSNQKYPPLILHSKAVCLSLKVEKAITSLWERLMRKYRHCSEQECRSLEKDWSSILKVLTGILLNVQLFILTKIKLIYNDLCCDYTSINNCIVHP